MRRVSKKGMGRWDNVYSKIKAYKKNKGMYKRGDKDKKEAGGMEGIIAWEATQRHYYREGIGDVDDDDVGRRAQTGAAWFGGRPTCGSHPHKNRRSLDKHRYPVGDASFAQ